ncbi:Uncharacterized protein DBV15_11411 [Temnothorax longispinosus]|uniref:Uncharacterized protein n=1 Tax=Temnothorax longispinosus TaxID=300112 RepID=A0A4S2KQ60_9HYME|nr:Uncharacterized protein DBV15_11411 [Temnothorax longispinosus]
MQNRGRTFVRPLTAALATSTLGDIIRQTLGRGDLSCCTSVRTVISAFRKICKVAPRRLGKCEHIDISVYQWRRLVVKVSESDSSQLRKASPDSIPVAFTSGRPPAPFQFRILSTMTFEIRARRNYRKILLQNLIVDVEKYI